jgi:hypothetical protein
LLPIKVPASRSAASVIGGQGSDEKRQQVRHGG